MLDVGCWRAGCRRRNRTLSQPTSKIQHQYTDSMFNTPIAADLTAVAEGATKPSQGTVQKVVKDLTAATAGKNPTSREIPQLTSDFNKDLNSAGNSVPEFNALVSGAQAL